MATLNRVFLLGNLTRDPEVRYLPSGTGVTDLRLAVSRKYKTAAGEEKEETCYVNVVVWGRQGEACGQYLSKGSPILVEGRLQYEEWEKNGQKNSRLRVVADRVQFIGPPRKAARESAAAEPAAAPAPAPVAAGDAAAEASPAESTPSGGDDDNLPF
jgi:single-strand DNA-binding protein